MIPVYVGNELLPRGTHVIAQAIDNPDALKINVWVFNGQPGVNVNYASGFNER
nr:hypothetical protein [Lacticaseibacillus paracasei]